ncbi:integrase, catalytic region, zinc finger, CCHC-type containing protein [Tanacetum coccineum]
MTGDRSQLTNFVHKFLGTVKFSNNQIAKIMGYSDYQIGNITISRVYYVEGLGHNLFFVSQFCDLDLEVAFRKHMCFVRNLEGVDLLSGSQETNLYTLSIRDMMASSPIYLLSKASKTKSWLWHRQLSHLNFGAINHLAKNSLIRGLPRLKFEKDHLCSACSIGKSKKQSHKPKSKDTNQEKLNLLHMDLCGPMHVASINGKKLLHDRKPDLSYLHFFGALCYLNNDMEDLGKLQAKADIGILIGYAPRKKAYYIYNRRPGLQFLILATSSLGLVPNPIPQQHFPIANAPRALDLADSLVSTSIEQDAPSISIPSTQDQEHSLIIFQGFEELPKTPHFHDDPHHESFHEDSTSQGSSSNVRPIHTPFESLGRWTKDHPIANVIGDLSHSVSTRKQLQTDAMWCYFDAFLTSLEPKNFKQEMTEPS